MAFVSSSKTTGLVSRKAFLHLLSARTGLVQQRQNMQGCVPLDVLCTCQAHRPHTVISRDKDFTPECCWQVSFGSMLSFLQFIQRKPCALLQARFLRVSTQWPSQTSMKVWILAKPSVQGLTLACKSEQQRRYWCCLLGCLSICSCYKGCLMIATGKKHSWLLKGSLRLYHTLMSCMKIFPSFHGFLCPAQEGED